MMEQRDIRLTPYITKFTWKDVLVTLCLLPLVVLGAPFAIMGMYGKRSK